MFVCGCYLYLMTLCNMSHGLFLTGWHDAGEFQPIKDKMRLFIPFREDHNINIELSRMKWSIYNRCNNEAKSILLQYWYVSSNIDEVLSILDKLLLDRDKECYAL